VRIHRPGRPPRRPKPAVGREHERDDEEEEEAHGLPRDGLDEAVEDLGDGLGGEAGRADEEGVPLHARRPLVALPPHRRHPLTRRLAAVLAVVPGAHVDVGHGVGHVLRHLHVHVVLDHRRQVQRGTHQQAHREEVQEELDVARDGVWEWAVAAGHTVGGRARVVGGGREEIIRGVRRSGP
jgi:hypothetical protein